MKKFHIKVAIWSWVLFMMLIVPDIAMASECREIDHEHSAWTSLLQRTVSDGLVDYAALDKEGRAPLAAYLGDLSAACAIDYEKWTRDQRLAFWINAYNAFTVQLILDNYPIKSIRKIGWLPLEAFRRSFIPMPGLKGELISLNDIENDTLRANFSEPRIHFALVCASIGCPPLRNDAYRASVLDRQLDEQTYSFMKDTTKNRFNADTGTLFLSPIFDWFEADFVAVSGSVPAYVAQYLNDPGITGPRVEIDYTKYDWNLNDTKTLR